MLTTTLIYFLVKISLLAMIIGCSHFILETFNKGKEMSGADILFTFIAFAIVLTFIDFFNVIG